MREKPKNVELQKFPSKRKKQEWLTRFVLGGVHDVGAPDGVADEAEETERQAEEDARENWVAVPHAAQRRRRLVIHAHGACHYSGATFSLIFIQLNLIRDTLRWRNDFMEPHLDFVLQDAVEELGEIFGRQNLHVLFRQVVQVVGGVDDDQAGHGQRRHGYRIGQLRRTGPTEQEIPGKKNF